MMKSDLILKQGPRLLLFEGIDGSGKTTVLTRIKKTFDQFGLKNVILSEPTRSRTGTQIRRLLSSTRPDNKRLLDLFIEDRMHDVENNILPALNEGCIVLLDRYYYSNAAYQAASPGEAAAIIRRNRDLLFPETDRIYYLDIPVDDALKRISARNEGTFDCFENRPALEAIKQRYRHVLPATTRYIDARATPEDISKAVINDITLLQQADEIPR